MNGILESTYQRKLLRKWKPLIEAGPAIESEYTQTALAQVLESTDQYFRRSGMITEVNAGIGTTNVINGKTNTGADGVLGPGDYNWPTIVMPMLRRIFPTLMAHELVGVQPMTGPIGYALALRATYGVDGGDVGGTTSSDEYSNTEIGYRNILTQFTGKNRADGDHLSATFAGGVENYPTGIGGQKPTGITGTVQDMTADAAWQAYAGTTAGGINDYLGIAQQTDTAEWADLGTNYPTVRFNLVKKSVDARTRKLAANWSPELAEDMAAMHGINVEEEMMNILSYEIGAEIDRQLITEMVAAAILGKQTSTWEVSAADGLDQLGRLSTILTHLTIEGQNIALRSRRGNANFCIASPKVTAVLQQLTANRFVGNENGKMPTMPKPGLGTLTKVGLINDGQQLLIRDTFAGGDFALLGFKGDHPGDSGIIYCPYIPIQLAKIPAITANFTPAVGARTRYGIMSTPWDAKNYYHMVKINLDGNYTLNGDRKFLQNQSLETVAS